MTCSHYPRLIQHSEFDQEVTGINISTLSEWLRGQHFYCLPKDAIVLPSTLWMRGIIAASTQSLLTDQESLGGSVMTDSTYSNIPLIPFIKEGWTEQRKRWGHGDMAWWLHALDALRKGPVFSSQQPYGRSQMPITPVPGCLLPSSGFHEKYTYKVLCCGITLQSVVIYVPLTGW